MNQRKEKKLLAALLASLLVWMTVLAHGAIPAQQVQMFQEIENEGSGQRKEGIPGGLYELAWWGSLYPRTCLKSAMKLVDEQENQDLEADLTEEREAREQQAENPKEKEAGQIEEPREKEAGRTKEPEEREAGRTEESKEKEAGQGKEPKTEEETEQDLKTRIPVKIKWKCMDLF